MATLPSRTSWMNKLLYILFGVQLLFTVLTNQFYNLVAFVDNNSPTDGDLLGLFSLLAVAAAVTLVVGFGRLNSPVLMYLSIELLAVLYRFFLHPSQIGKPANLIYTLAVAGLYIFFLLKLRASRRSDKARQPQHQTKEEMEAEESEGAVAAEAAASVDSINLDQDQPAALQPDEDTPGPGSKLGMLFFYAVTFLLVLLTLILPKYGKDGNPLPAMTYLKISYFYVLLSLAYIYVGNTVVRKHVKIILVLILTFTVIKFMLPVLYILPLMGYIIWYGGYYLIYAMLALLIINALYALLHNNRPLPLLSGYADKISI